MKQARVVLDTNVLISALLFGGTPRDMLEMVLTGSVRCSLSLAILNELRGVLQRRKFAFSAQQVAAIVEELSTVCDIVSPSVTVRVVTADPDDNRILECALEAKADVIVSGDSHLLQLGQYKRIRILSPFEFLQAIRANAPTAKRGRKPKP